MKSRDARWGFATFLIMALFLSVGAQAAQKDFQRLTVGYTPDFRRGDSVLHRGGRKNLSKIWLRGCSGIYGWVAADQFGDSCWGISDWLHGRRSDHLEPPRREVILIAIASPLPVLTIDGWAKPEIKSVSDLRGKRVGVTRFGASSYFAGLSMLESAGIKPSEVTFIQNGGVGESYAALLGGRVDVCMIGYPFGLRAKKEGFHLLFRPSDTEYGLFPDRRHWSP